MFTLVCLEERGRKKKHGVEIGGEKIESKNANG